MATGVWSWDTTAANNANADSTINWAEGQDPSTVNNSARAEMAGMAKYLLDAHGALTTTGAANTYSVTTNSSMAALRDGLGLSLVINVSPNGASTLNVDGLGAKAIRKITSAGEAAIGTGDMIAAGHYIFDYDASANSSAGAWILLNPTASDGMSDLVDDTTPQLGGDLDVNSNGIAFSGATVTDVTGADTTLVSGTAGTSGNLASWNADGDAVDSGVVAANVLVDGDIGSSVQAYDADTAKTDVAQEFTALQTGDVEAMSDGATITPTGTKHYHTVTLGGNRTLANPTAITAGATYVFKITQDGTGSRTLSWGAAYDWAGGTAPTLSTGAADVDVFSGTSLDGTSIQMVTVGQDYS